MTQVKSKTRSVVQRGTRANQPLATVVLEGTLYFVTDESVIERSSGSAWQSFSGGAGGSGDVVGPAASTDNAIARYDGVTGKLLQDSGITINDSGQLGIGVTATEPITVFSNSLANLASFTRQQSVAGGAQFLVRKARDSAGAPAIVADGDTIGAFSFQAHDGVGYFGIGQIRYIVDGVPGVNDLPSKLEITTVADGGTTQVTRFTIRNNGNIEIANDIIFTASKVLRTDANNRNIAFCGGSVAFDPASGSIISLYGSSHASRAGNFELYVGTNAASQFTLYRNDATTIGIQMLGSNGRVGIGIAPSYITHFKAPNNNVTSIATLAGNAHFFEGSNASGASWGLSVAYENNIGVMIIQANDRGASVSRNLSINPFGGDIGVGTLSPNRGGYTGRIFTIENAVANSQSAFEIVGNRSVASAAAGTLSFHNISATQADKRIAIINGQVGTGGDVDSGALLFRTADNSGVMNSRMIIDESGNIGIGTNTPSYKLAISNAGAETFDFRPGAAGACVQYAYDRTALAYVKHHLVALSYEIQVASGPSLVLDALLNVGIGTATFGTGAAKVLALANTGAPTSSPAGIGQMWVESGALKYRGSSGTVTTLGPA